MSALSIQPTFPIFTETDGLPLENGYIWIGAANLDPQGNPINVYWDAVLTIAAPRPIRTINGYPSRNGTPARMYVNSDYSIRVQNSKGSLVYSASAATERYSYVVVSINAENVVYDPPFTNAAQTNVEAKLQQTVSVQDFGAVGDGVANDTAAIQAAIVAVSTGTNGGGTVYLPRGNYLTTSTIYLPQSVALIGDGRRPGPLGPSVSNIEGSCIIGKHTGAAVVSMKGSAFCGLRHISLLGDQATTPKTGLCLGRTTGGASAGRHHCEDIEVAGWFTAAAIYSIASEEPTFVNVHGLVLGGGAKYTFYTSADDDLNVDALTSSSNFWANTFNGFNLLHQGNTNDSAAIFIKVSAGTLGWVFRDGFTGMTSGTNSSHIILHITGDSVYARDFVFDGVSSESTSNASPPISNFRVTSSLPCTLRGLRIQNCTPGQILGGTQNFLFSSDNIILDGLFFNQASSDYPSSIWRLTNSNVNTPEQNLIVRSGIISSVINSKQTIHQGGLGQVTKTLSLNGIYGPVRFTGTGVNAMTIPSTVVMTGLVQRNVYVEIDGTPTPNTFKWSVDGGSTFVATNVPITATIPQSLQDAIFIVFSQGTGLTIGDNWQCLFDPVLLPTVTH